MNDVTTTNEREEVLAGLADSVWKLDAAMATELKYDDQPLGSKVEKP